MSNGWGITNLSLYVWLWRFQNAASSSFSVNRGAFHRSDPSHMSNPLTFSDALRAFKTSTRIRGRAPSATRCAFVSRMSTARLSASRRIFAASFPVHSRQRGSSHLQPCMYSGRLGSWSFTGQGFHIDVEPTHLAESAPEPAPLARLNMGRPAQPFDTDLAAPIFMCLAPWSSRMSVANVESTPRERALDMDEVPARSMGLLSPSRRRADGVAIDELTEEDRRRPDTLVHRVPAYWRSRPLQTIHNGRTTVCVRMCCSCCR